MERIRQDPTLLDDKDLFEKDLDVFEAADHTVLIHGLPKLPREELESKMKDILIETMKKDNVPNPEN